jgi:hypothetical protein
MRAIALRRSVLTIGFSAFSHNSAVNNSLDSLTRFFLDARSQANQPFVKKDAGVEPINYFSLGRLNELLGNPLLSPDWLQVNVGGKAISFDLCDRTPNIEQITEAANQLHAESLAPMNATATEVVDHYIRHLKSERFAKHLETASASMKDQASRFRQRMGQAGPIKALDRFIK